MHRSLSMPGCPPRRRPSRERDRRAGTDGTRSRVERLDEVVAHEPVLPRLIVCGYPSSCLTVSFVGASVIRSPKDTTQDLSTFGFGWFGVITSSAARQPARCIRQSLTKPSLARISPTSRAARILSGPHSDIDSQNPQPSIAKVRADRPGRESIIGGVAGAGSHRKGALRKLRRCDRASGLLVRYNHNQQRWVDLQAKLPQAKPFHP
jgi:hypothetical protein